MYRNRSLLRTFLNFAKPCFGVFLFFYDSICLNIKSKIIVKKYSFLFRILSRDFIEEKNEVLLQGNKEALTFSKKKSYFFCSSLDKIIFCSQPVKMLLKLGSQ